MLRSLGSKEADRASRSQMWSGVRTILSLLQDTSQLTFLALLERH